MMNKRLAIIGMDSVSLWFLDTFVERGVMPNVKKLMERGAVTQTWPCWPWETGTNWPCLSTGASPWVHGVNMHMHVEGTPLDEWVGGFDPALGRAEHLWEACQRAGKQAIVFDWAQSWPLKTQDHIIHIGENGGPTWSERALQNSAAYGTSVNNEGWWESQILNSIDPRPVSDWPGAPEGALYFEMPVRPGFESRYTSVSSLHALILRGADGFDRVALYAEQGADTPLLECRLNEMSDWAFHDFETDLGTVRAPVRAKLLRLSPDGKDVHIALSQIYSQEDFVHPTSLAKELTDRCGPFVRLPLPQQSVTFGVTDVPTFTEEQEYFSRWNTKAIKYLLSNKPWDLFMIKWHTPDWFQHLTFYMLEEQHPLYDPERADEGWALWDRIMSWGDEMVGAVMRAVGEDALIGIVSDHGGECILPGVTSSLDVNALLEEKGWLTHAADGAVDWPRTKAYSHGNYVFVNLKGRDPDGIVEAGEAFDVLREDIMQALADARDENGRRYFQAILPMEDAGRLGVGGDRVGDIFLVNARPHPGARVDKKAFWKEHTREEVGTWDWPLMNAGGHADDSFFLLAGPGVKKGYRRERSTLITSVAPTAATAAGLPVPKDADGSVLYDFLDTNSPR